MEWLIDEVFSQAKWIGEQLAAAYNDDQIPAGVYNIVRIGDTIYPASKRYVFRAECRKPLTRLTEGLVRADKESQNLPPDIAAEVRALQRIVNGSVGKISDYDRAMYYDCSDIGECGRRGWSAIVRHLKGVPFPIADATPKTSELTSPSPADVGAELSPAAAAILCEDFIRAVDEYFLWHRMIPPPHQVGTLEGTLIGDFGASAADFESRRIRSAVWLRDNGPALAAALERHGLKSIPVLRIVGFIDDPDAVPSTFLPLWKDTKVTLQQAAIQLRNEPAPPAAKPKQGEGVSNAGSVPSTDASKVRNFHADPPETIQELVFLWLRTSEYSKDKTPWVADLIREAIRKAPGGPKIENCCLVRFGEFTFTTAQRLLAEVALSRGQTFADYLPLAVSTVADYLPDPPPTGTAKRGEGNDGAGSGQFVVTKDELLGYDILGSPWYSQWRLLRDEFQHAYRQSLPKKLRCALQLRVGIPHESDTEKDWRPDLESRVGNCPRLLWFNWLRPGRRVILNCFFGDVDSGELNSFLFERERTTNLFCSDSRLSTLGVDDWVLALYYIAWRVPRVVPYTVECYSFTPDGMPRSELPFTGHEAFESWERGDRTDTPPGRYFLLLSDDVRFCSMAAIDFLQNPVFLRRPGRPDPVGFAHVPTAEESQSGEGTGGAGAAATTSNTKGESMVDPVSIPYLLDDAAEVFQLAGIAGRYPFPGASAAFEPENFETRLAAFNEMCTVLNGLVFDLKQAPPPVLGRVFTWLHEVDHLRLLWLNVSKDPGSFFDDLFPRLADLSREGKQAVEDARELLSGTTNSTASKAEEAKIAKSAPSSAAAAIVPPVDFMILTALEEEREALLALLAGHRRVAPTNDDVRVYFEAQLPTNGLSDPKCSYKIIVASPLGMGRVHATTVAADAIRRWRPRYMLLVGVAGGVSSSGVNLGDLIVANQVVDYELQKLTGAEPEIRWNSHQVDPRLLAAAQHFSADKCLPLMKTARPGEGKSVRYIGPVASGDKVIACEEVLKQYKKGWPKLLGVEMEAGGAASAAFQVPNPPGFFMVRAVSDLADADKNSPKIADWRLYACDLAAAYAIALLQDGPVPLLKDAG